MNAILIGSRNQSFPSHAIGFFKMIENQSHYTRPAALKATACFICLYTEKTGLGYMQKCIGKVESSGKKNKAARRRP
jgi:hypothetical protein